MSEAPAATPAQPSDARLPRRRLALASLVGALMVALPLGQVLRYQDAEIQTLAERRAALDPIARAVDVQRGLLVHRTLAGAVLRGRKALEDERRARQGEVDARLATLAAVLGAGPWALAEREGEALALDWALLAQQVSTRSLSAAGSDESHGLRVEQVLQVIDLLTDALTPVGAAGDEATSWHAARRLPQRAAQDAAAGSDAWPARMAEFDAALQTASATLETRHARVHTTQRALLAALAALGLGQALLLRQLWRGVARRAGSRRDDGAFAAPPHPDRKAAGHLMQRLRRGEDTASAPLDTR